ncbi:dienelactone hydrolase [Talaromyces proteolyticus]|uniref:Dienelactone hydrolase n=1 Tax=Talaromyces proteolyticus TaxID=1131652 RepID=A0AAD4KI35_9EURO|nr:dienelactone hydrolase [Talaromyces proteolyticus]KAH8692161.1 dienelactone hydrolase [Talaromyces proteolyticus]
MASNPPASCCATGFKHEGTAKGKLSNLKDFEVYVSYPDSGSTEKGILILTDIIGHKLINVQLIADQFAQKGYFVMIPDLFDGDPVPLNKPSDFDMPTWRNGKYHPDGTAHISSNIDPIVDACLSEMRTKYGCKKIGAVGYCFGAKYVVRHLQPKSGKVDVGYIAHPSHVTPEELRGIKGPLAIAAAETDSIFPAEKRRESEDILRELGLPYQINLYSGVKHGFAARGDPNDRIVAYAKVTAFVQAVQWFGEFLLSV